MPKLPHAPDPVVTAFLRRILTESVRHYRAADATFQKIKLARPDDTKGQAWADLIASAEKAFLSADHELAERLNDIVDRLAPRRRGESVECGAMLDGHYYILPDDPDDILPERSMVASLPVSLVVNLDD